MTITSQAEYDQALRRMRELADLPDGTPGAETEMKNLVELTRQWEAKQGAAGRKAGDRAGASAAGGPGDE